MLLPPVDLYNLIFSFNLRDVTPKPFPFPVSYISSIVGTTGRVKEGEKTIPLNIPESSTSTKKSREA